jgi:hypothetical protein
MATPDPIYAAADFEALTTLLTRMQQRITELERRTTGLGQRITVGSITLSDVGGQLVATRNTDGATAVVADFT